MSRGGQNCDQLWDKLDSVRKEIDSLYDEKLMLVKKMYNLAQKFV